MQSVSTVEFVLLLSKGVIRWYLTLKVYRSLRIGRPIRALNDIKDVTIPIVRKCSVSVCFSFFFPSNMFFFCSGSLGFEHLPKQRLHYNLPWRAGGPK